MHPIGVANAAWVFAAAPSKVPFYVAGGLLAGWAVLLAAFGITHAGFPGSHGRAWLVIATSALLVAATISMAVVTAGEEAEHVEARATGGASGSAGQAGVLAIDADPTGRPAYDKKQATVASGHVELRFGNRSPVPHNVTIAKDGKVVARTKTIEDATVTVAADLPRGAYVFYCSVDQHRQAGMRGTLAVR
jgi:plastocyanin